jgi:glycosyltransferase involved in cell wall biosynthesis
MLQSLHIIGSRQMGGAESFFLRLVRALNRSDHHACVAVRPKSPLTGKFNESTPVYRVPMRNGFDLFSVAAIRKLIRSTGVDIVQTYMGRASRLTRLPKDARAVHVARLGGFYKVDGYYRHADAWVGNTTALCDYLVREGLPARRVFHISNFVDPAKPVKPQEVAALRESLGIPRDAIVLFALGRFIDIKGFDDLIEAFALIDAQAIAKPLHLVLAGDGPLRGRLLDLASGLGLAGRFHWAGWVQDPSPYMHMADLFIVPSSHETLGNVILEAWSYELPVISTQTPGALELIENGRNGLLVPCRDARALAGSISSCLDDRSGLLAGLAAAGRERLEANHSSAAITGAYLDMYETLCGSA